MECWARLQFFVKSLDAYQRRDLEIFVLQVLGCYSKQLLPVHCSQTRTC